MFRGSVTGALPQAPLTLRRARSGLTEGIWRAARRMGSEEVLLSQQDRRWIAEAHGILTRIGSGPNNPLNDRFSELMAEPCAATLSPPRAIDQIVHMQAILDGMDFNEGPAEQRPVLSEDTQHCEMDGIRLAIHRSSRVHRDGLFEQPRDYGPLPMILHKGGLIVPCHPAEGLAVYCQLVDTPVPTVVQISMHGFDAVSGSHCLTEVDRPIIPKLEEEPSSPEASPLDMAHFMLRLTSAYIELDENTHAICAATPSPLCPEKCPNASHLVWYAIMITLSELFYGEAIYPIDIDPNMKLDDKHLNLQDCELANCLFRIGLSLGLPFQISRHDVVHLRGGRVADLFTWVMRNGGDILGTLRIDDFPQYTFAAQQSLDAILSEKGIPEDTLSLISFIHRDITEKRGFYQHIAQGLMGGEHYRLLSQVDSCFERILRIKIDEDIRDVLGFKHGSGPCNTRRLLTTALLSWEKRKQAVAKERERIRRSNLKRSILLNESPVTAHALAPDPIPYDALDQGIMLLGLTSSYCAEMVAATLNPLMADRPRSLSDLAWRALVIALCENNRELCPAAIRPDMSLEDLGIVGSAPQDLFPLFLRLKGFLGLESKPHISINFTNAQSFIEWIKIKSSHGDGRFVDISPEGVSPINTEPDQTYRMVLAHHRMHGYCLLNLLTDTFFTVTPGIFQQVVRGLVGRESYGALHGIEQLINSLGFWPSLQRILLRAKAHWLRRKEEACTSRAWYRGHLLALGIGAEAPYAKPYGRLEARILAMRLASTVVAIEDGKIVRHIISPLAPTLGMSRSQFLWSCLRLAFAEQDPTMPIITADTKIKSLNISVIGLRNILLRLGFYLGFSTTQWMSQAFRTQARYSASDIFHWMRQEIDGAFDDAAPPHESYRRDEGPQTYRELLEARSIGQGTPLFFYLARAESRLTIAEVPDLIDDVCKNPTAELFSHWEQHRRELGHWNNGMSFITDIEHARAGFDTLLKKARLRWSRSWSRRQRDLAVLRDGRADLREGKGEAVLLTKTNPAFRCDGVRDPTRPTPDPSLVWVRQLTPLASPDDLAVIGALDIAIDTGAARYVARHEDAIASLIRALNADPNDFIARYRSNRFVPLQGRLAMEDGGTSDETANYEGLKHRQNAYFDGVRAAAETPDLVPLSLSGGYCLQAMPPRANVVDCLAITGLRVTVVTPKLFALLGGPRLPDSTEMP
jgi:hypothetical protein